MFIGRELKTKYGLLDAKTMIQKTQEVFDRLELHLDPRTMVRELDASYKQIVEISRAMMMEASPDYHGRAHHLPDRPGD